MFDWIKQNKEWLFSGVGISVIMILIAITKLYLKNKREILDKKNKIIRTKSTVNINSKNIIKGNIAGKNIIYGKKESK